MILRGKFYCIMHQKYVLECANENSVCVCVCACVTAGENIECAWMCVSVILSMKSEL